MITPHSFTVVFIVADVLCIMVQGIGGGMAGTSDTLRQANNGAYVMTAGVCLQRESIYLDESDSSLRHAALLRSLRRVHLPLPQVAAAAEAARYSHPVPPSALLGEEALRSHFAQPERRGEAGWGVHRAFHWRRIAQQDYDDDLRPRLHDAADQHPVGNGTEQS